MAIDVPEHGKSHLATLMRPRERIYTPYRTFHEHRHHDEQEARITSIPWVMLGHLSQ